jgi:hypothetical protein
MRTLLSITVSSTLAAPVWAADVTVTLEIPKLNVAEYHRPYVAIWLEGPDQSFLGNLAVWYDLKLKNNEGTKWLKDMRQWWRKSGRQLSMPVDGLSSATRAPGEHSVKFALNEAPMKSLTPGDYHLVIEAAREVGGRELLRVPFNWPVTDAQTHQGKGEHELGLVSIELRP